MPLRQQLAVCRARLALRLEAARRYAKAIPRSSIADLDPLVLLVVPSARRARSVAATLADGPWPITVEAWTSGSESPLDVAFRASSSTTSSC